jgi:hypothetical protein
MIAGLSCVDGIVARGGPAGNAFEAAAQTFGGAAKIEGVPNDLRRGGAGLMLHVRRLKMFMKVMEQHYGERCSING